jgi:glycosyltransferase involved in cell wall biosynthesis
MTALTALIPSFNDAYTLHFCLESIAPYFHEVIVLDDASVDETPYILDRACSKWPHVQVERHAGIPLGPIRARNRLLELARGDHLFFLDADDVLIEESVPLLHEIVGMAPVVGVQLAEMWGDFNHTTQRLEHYDPCHIYMNRTVLRDILWGGHGNLLQRPTYTVVDERTGTEKVRGPGPLFWHLKGTKPDWRVAGRPRVRRWLAKGRQDYYFDAILAQDPELNHRLAVDRLLNNSVDRIRPFEGTPRRPAVLEAAEPRFEMVYRDGKLVDRIDHGWWACSQRQPPVSPFFASRVRPVRPLAFTLRRVDGQTFGLSADGQWLRVDYMACAIWSLCDGQSTIRQISERLAAAFPDRPETAVHDAVLEAVLTLYWHQALELEDSP